MGREGKSTSPMPLKIPIQLVNEQPHSGNNQIIVGGLVKGIITLVRLPARNEKHNRDQGRYLPQFHPDIETDDLRQKLRCAHIKGLQAGG